MIKENVFYFLSNKIRMSEGDDKWEIPVYFPFALFVFWKKRSDFAYNIINR